MINLEKRDQQQYLEEINPMCSKNIFDLIRMCIGLRNYVIGVFINLQNFSFLVVSGSWIILSSLLSIPFFCISDIMPHIRIQSSFLLVCPDSIELFAQCQSSSSFITVIPNQFACPLNANFAQP